MNKYTFRLLDNWHIHPRQDELMDAIIHHFSIYGRALCMGNTKPLIETPDGALLYRSDILSRKVLFKPVMCIMLTQDTTPEMIYEAARKGIKFVKFIPVGTSYGASRGLRLDDFDSLFKIFVAIEDAGLHLLVHAELISSHSGTEIHLIDREEAAIPIIDRYHKLFSGMKITVEHASTAKMINFIRSCSGNVRATLTPQHALMTYDDVFDSCDNMINPYNYCLPVLKREADRLAVAQVMVSGDERFFAGTDAAPHWAYQKDSDSPPAGIFFGSTECLQYLKVFKEASAISRFEDFTSRFGAETYGFSLNTGTITVVQEEWITPIQENGIRFCMGGELLNYKIVEVNRGVC